MPKQKESKELNTSIKDFVTIMDKQIGKLKSDDPKSALKETTSKDNKGNMTKDVNDSHKPKTQKTPKTPKQQINDTTQSDNTQKSTTCKRSASQISPIEDKPGKKQKEKPTTTQPDTITKTTDIQQEEASITQRADKIRDISTEQEHHNQTGPYLEHGYDNTNPILQELLTTLRDIQKSIVDLDGKLDRELNTREKEHTELNEKLTTQQIKIKSLETANKELKEENKIIQNNLLNMQKELLRLKVDFIGIPESPYETPDQLRNKILEAMLPTCDGPTEEIRWQTCKNIPISDCHRIGSYSKTKKRAVRVTYMLMQHKLCLLSRKNALNPGIYVDEAYPEQIQKRRMSLRPILKLAKSKPEYKGKCKLEYDKLIIKGIHYTVNTLNKLPIDLAPYKTAQISSSTSTIFHGQHSPLSNFHYSPFTINGQEFQTAEKYIQYQKASYFNDVETAEKILISKDPFESKTLSRNIVNYDNEAWKHNAKSICYPGIQAKFEQNPLLAKFLIATKPTTLAESCYDRLWGTGMALQDKNALNESHWANIGILGSILMDLRDNILPSKMD